MSKDLIFGELFKLVAYQNKPLVLPVNVPIQTYTRIGYVQSLRGH